MAKLQNCKMTSKKISYLIGNYGLQVIASTWRAWKRQKRSKTPDDGQRWLNILRNRVRPLSTLQSRITEGRSGNEVEDIEWDQLEHFTVKLIAEGLKPINWKIAVVNSFVTPREWSLAWPRSTILRVRKPSRCIPAFAEKGINQIIQPWPLTGNSESKPRLSRVLLGIVKLTISLRLKRTHVGMQVSTRNRVPTWVCQTLGICLKQIDWCKACGSLVNQMKLCDLLLSLTFNTLKKIRLQQDERVVPVELSLQ